jgi:hypothetical protein
LKRGWMKFWLCVSFAALAVSAAAVPQKSKGGKGANELTIAGLRPGRDKLASAKDKFGKKLPTTEGLADQQIEWRDFCGGETLRVETDRDGVIQSLQISASEPMRRCSPEALEAEKYTANWKTGHGLRLGDKLERVITIYGPPNSKGPGESADQKLDLLFYMFDWAGSDVPQVMEISCDKTTGRVVDIMLAFPSL